MSDEEVDRLLEEVTKKLNHKYRNMLRESEAETISVEVKDESHNTIPDETMCESKNTLVRDCFWCGDEWKQPPVRIKHGDLVDVKADGYLGTMLGRYIGKGYGVVELYNYATGVKHVVGKVESRGLDGNPRLISDEELFDFIKD